jgi:hypothetical protein
MRRWSFGTELAQRHDEMSETEAAGGPDGADEPHVGGDQRLRAGFFNSS